jgi:hypothetical protein
MVEAYQVLPFVFEVIGEATVLDLLGQNFLVKQGSQCKLLASDPRKAPLPLSDGLVVDSCCLALIEGEGAVRACGSKPNTKEVVVEPIGRGSSDELYLFSEVGSDVNVTCGETPTRTERMSGANFIQSTCNLGIGGRTFSVRKQSQNPEFKVSKLADVFKTQWETLSQVNRSEPKHWTANDRLDWLYFMFGLEVSNDLALEIITSVIGAGTTVIMTLVASMCTRAVVRKCCSKKTIVPIYAVTAQHAPSAPAFDRGSDIRRQRWRFTRE